MFRLAHFCEAHYTRSPTMKQENAEQLFMNDIFLI
ncbi:uncharacterized protein METZ01_LOCUS199511 [marine metagenome]|uniref:Uncharacterized protein n=1 Tax=marine metagenome TaxID=408172 RepID=A0A382E9V4_9ZZZZ